MATRSSSSPPSSPLSVLSKSPSPPRSIVVLDPTERYPSPSSTLQSGSASPIKVTTRFPGESRTCSDGPPPAKRRRTHGPKTRTTEYLDLEDMDEHSDEQLERLLSTLRRKKKIVVVAGAGISVSAGIPDFRSSTGLFKTLRGQHNVKASGKHLFDASVYRNDQSTSSFHDMVRGLAHMTQNAKPTAFHHLLASLAHEGRLMRLYTQNVDCIDTSMPPLATNIPLNTKGPWPTSIQLHGGLGKMVCSKCAHLSPFQGSMFEGPQAPVCGECVEQDNVRTLFGGKRSHGVGRLRPRIVLYNEYNPDEDAIGAVSKADLRRVPDAVLVVGTTLKIPGIRRLVKEMCQVTRSRRDGFTAWINLDSEPQGVEFKDCWDLVVRGKSDDVAELANLPHWDQQDIGDAWKVTGDPEMEARCKSHLDRSHIDITLEGKSGPKPIKKEEKPEKAGLKLKVVEQAQAGIPTPIASPTIRPTVPEASTTKVKTQSKLSFTSNVDGVAPTTKSATKSDAKARKPRTAKSKVAKPKSDITKTFKATKNVSAAAAAAAAAEKPKTPKKKALLAPESSPLSSPSTTGKDDDDVLAASRKLPPLLTPSKDVSAESDLASDVPTSPLAYREGNAPRTTLPSSKPKARKKLVG